MERTGIAEKPGTRNPAMHKAQGEEKVVGMRKEISSFAKEIYCGRVRRSIICIKIESTLIKFVHTTNL